MPAITQRVFSGSPNETRTCFSATSFIIYQGRQGSWNIQRTQTAMNIYPLNLGFSQAYLVATSTGMVLVDTGMPRQEGAIQRLLMKLGPIELKLILVTHAHLDHCGSA